MNLTITDIAPEILASKCYQYADDVLQGRIIACRKVIQACQRFLDDLHRMRDPKFPWVFDLGKAYRPINFIEKFCRPTKGEIDRMELLGWQHFVEGNVYGWIEKTTGLRRYREALILVARGSGKSTIVGGNAEYGASKDGERGAEVDLLANSKEQAGIIFEECKAQIKNSDLLNKHFRALRSVIYYDKTNSKIQPRASDSKKLDGLNPHLAIFDEIHEFTDWKLINVIKRPMKKKRKNPLIIYISTMGTQLNGPLIQLYQLATDVLNGTGAVKASVADRFFAYIAEIDEEDDPNDCRCWIKANPSMGVLYQLSDLQEDWDRAKLVPEERSDFINKQLNVFTQTDELSMFDAQTIRANSRYLPMEVLQGQRCHGGFDLSETEDYTSACLEFDLGDGAIFALSHSWTTQKKVDIDREGLDYAGLVREGLLTISAGAFVDYTDVYRWFVEQAKRYKIETIGYDPANAHFLVQELAEAGFKLEAVRQGAYTLNAPVKHLKELFLAGKVVHNNNRMLNWYLSNVKVCRDRAGNWLPTKQNRYRKIDGFAALLNAHTEYMRAHPEPGIKPDAHLVTVINLKEVN
ncbi:terminase large subunit [Gehongia tenuis]|uniref:terminase large subunit n=1 Tax=Gehongia tenuis TaxID=2763655 RepID=UPI0038B27DE2